MASAPVTTADLHRVGEESFDCSSLARAYP
jgi:hypothetical protein